MGKIKLSRKEKKMLPDIWSLDYSMSQWLVPRLELFKKVALEDVECPCSLWDLNHDFNVTDGEADLEADGQSARMQWTALIDRFIWTFKHFGDDEAWEPGDPFHPEEDPAVMLYLKYFVKYLETLWW